MKSPDPKNLSIEQMMEAEKIGNFLATTAHNMGMAGSEDKKAASVFWEETIKTFVRKHFAQTERSSS